MIWNLIGVLITGLCMGAFAYLLRKLSRDKLSKAFIPIFAGVGMLGYLAFYDYDWYNFKSGVLPEGSQVISERRAKGFFRPWSYIVAPVNSFSVIDGTSKTMEQNDQILVEYIEYTFINDALERIETRTLVLNCSTRERVVYDKESKDAKVTIETVSSNDPAYRRLCL